MASFYSRKSRKQFRREAQPLNALYVSVWDNRRCYKGADYPISERRSRTTRIPAPPPPRTNFLKSLNLESISAGLSILVSFEPATGFGDSWFSVYNNGKFIESVFAPEGMISQTVINSNDGLNEITVLHTNQQNEIQDNVLEWAEKNGQKVKLSWVWPYEIIGNPESDLSNWDLTGLKIENTESGIFPTRRQLQLDITQNSGYVTVTGTQNNKEVFYGSGSISSSSSSSSSYYVPITITLSESNSSGISGSVDVAPSIKTEYSEILSLRLPAEMGIFRGLTTAPTTEITSIPYNSEDACTFIEQNALDADTYYYRLRAVSDTDDVGNYGEEVEIEVLGPPLPPSDLAVDSGDASALVLSFTESETLGATYNLYMRGINDELFPVDHPVATAVTESTTITAPSITGYPGVVSFILRAQLGEVEEKNLDSINVEFDEDGDVVLPRPNNASITTISVSDGNTINVGLLYYPQGESGVATTGQLFTRLSNEEYDFDSPDDTGAITGDEYKTTTLNATLSNGWHYITVKCATAAGTQSMTEAAEQVVYVSDENISSPSVVASIVGG